MTNLQDPEVAALTHQATRFLNRALAPCCDKCAARAECDRYQAGGTCVVAEEHQAEVLAALLKLPHVQPVDEPLCREFAKVDTCLGIIDRYIAHASPLLPGSDAGYLEAQPVMKTRASLSAQLLRLAGELGLSPAARARLRADPEKGPGADLAAALRDLAAQDRAKAAATVDGECEPMAEEAGTDGQAA
jgi:hypothetical protein